MDNELKCVFMLGTLPASWDTFCTVVNNSAPIFGNHNPTYGGHLSWLFRPDVTNGMAILSYCDL